MRICRQSATARQGDALVNRGSVVTIGNFDGLHLGHQAMLNQAADVAKRRDLPLVVVSFDPSPQAYFRKDNSAVRVMGVTDRVIALTQFPVHTLCLLPFNSRLAETSAEDFIRNVLLDDLACQHLIIGDDFVFGKDRLGDYNLLKQVGQENDMKVQALDTVADDIGRISSTRVRAALAAGDFDQVNSLLGRAYRISGRVVHGDARGRQIGFPTINLALRSPRPLSGVYAVVVEFETDGSRFNGVANLGVRPTVGGEKRLLEVFLFDFDRHCYRERVCVEFHKKIRDEQKFADFEQLKQQITQDKHAAQDWFNLTI